MSRSPSHLFFFIFLSLVVLMPLNALANRNGLEEVIRQCETAYLHNQELGGCSLLDHEQGYAILKTRNDFIQYLLLPLEHITGIEDNALLSGQSRPWFYFAWQARSMLGEQLLRTSPKAKLSEPDISLTINPQNQRSQDQMHIHISCLTPNVRQTLAALKPSAALTSGWMPVSLTSRTNQTVTYSAKLISSETLRTGNLFEMASRLTGEKLRYSVITVVPAVMGGFLVLVRSGDQNRPVGSEELQDHTCQVAKSR